MSRLTGWRSYVNHILIRIALSWILLPILLEDHNYIIFPKCQSNYLQEFWVFVLRRMIWRWVGWISCKKSHLLTACMSNKHITYFWNFMLWLILYLRWMMMLCIWFLTSYKIAHLEKFMLLCLPPSMSLYSAPAMFFFLLIEESIVSFFVFSFLFSSISKKIIKRVGLAFGHFFYQWSGQSCIILL